MAVSLDSLGVAVVGCGRIGSRRAEVAIAAGDRLTYAVDTDITRAAELGKKYGAPYSTRLDDALASEDVDVVVVATVNSALAEAVKSSIRSGKDVLCEKPLAVSKQEALSVGRVASAAASVVVKVGFNHRYHPALATAHDLVVRDTIGRPIAIRAIYGHGGRLGYEQEWRAKPELAGGGELLDQGVHLIDLARWFLGDLGVVAGATGTWCWPIAPIEDNAFALLATPDGRIATLHASWTQWRNLFRFEILGDRGCLTVEGLGGNYGVETLTLDELRSVGTMPNRSVRMFDGPDPSWRLEWEDFRNSVRNRCHPMGDLADGIAVAAIVSDIYESTRRTAQHLRRTQV